MSHGDMAWPPEQLDSSPVVQALAQSSRTEAAKFLASSRELAVPRFLYRFANLGKGVEQTILNSTLWLASPNTFNDPFDANAYLTVAAHSPAAQRAYLTKGFKRVGLSATQREQRASRLLATGSLQPTMQRSFHQEMGKLGVSCFAKASARSTLLWSHYADEHRGVCLVFHTSRAPSVFVMARRVAYSDDLPHIDWLNAKTRHDELFQALYRKAAVWSYECEYRIVLPHRASTTLALPASSLVAIVLGCASSDSLRNCIADLCVRRVANGHPAVRLFKARKASRKYALEVERLK
jgi:hypothetical protein